MRGTPLNANCLIIIPRIIPAHAGNSPQRQLLDHHSPDHPRACGELARSWRAMTRSSGSSPRMRGTRNTSSCGRHFSWIIPAHAGNSQHVILWPPLQLDHPRACGELHRPDPSHRSASGSSPRMRGTPLGGGAVEVGGRIIPAHAGNSHRSSEPCSSRADHPRACGDSPDSGGMTRTHADHPRACGELLSLNEDGTGQDGSSPRMRGTLHPAQLRSLGPTDHPRACGELQCGRRLVDVDVGSSPRMRGTLALQLLNPSESRIIPAHAGLHCSHRQLVARSGSSPRMRGTREPRRAAPVRPRIIPAHAGNSRACAGRVGTRADHPRACGELPSPDAVPLCCPGSSPRMRGTRARSPRRPRLRRIIPAHAGNSPRPGSARACDPDHPRACGELSGGSRSTVNSGGSSPRMRGTRTTACRRSSGIRIIPAHAGNSVEVEPVPSILSDHPRACGELPNCDKWANDYRGSSPRMRGTHRSALTETG